MKGEEQAAGTWDAKAAGYRRSAVRDKRWHRRARAAPHRPRSALDPGDVRGGLAALSRLSSDRGLSATLASPRLVGVPVLAVERCGLRLPLGQRHAAHGLRPPVAMELTARGRQGLRVLFQRCPRRSPRRGRRLRRLHGDSSDPARVVQEGALLARLGAGGACRRDYGNRAPRAGGGTHALPQQFTPVAMTMLLAAKTAAWEPAVRREVRVDPVARPSARHIVILVDESVRGDYLDFAPGNPYTPNLPGLRDRVADFGLASSGGNCGQYSNAILRLGGARNDLIHTMRTNPFIWQYARKAGFRTMYIDAQAPEDKNTGRLQNYMTVEEVKWIDEFVVIQNTSSPTLDFKALEMVGEKLKGDTPHFIYVNKNGAHFPYDKTYPADAVRFRPTMSEADGGNTMAARINSYRNSVSWSVDGFLRKLFEIDLSHSAVFYTSDHGQQFDPARLTHCTVSDPDPREGLVRLLLISGDPDLKSRFAEAAAINYDRASHFAIFPTVLQIMGYPLGFVRETFGERSE